MKKKTIKKINKSLKLVFGKIWILFQSIFWAFFGLVYFLLSMYYLGLAEKAFVSFDAVQTLPNFLAFFVLALFSFLPFSMSKTKFKSLR